MKFFLYVIFGLICVFLFIFFLWKFSSRKIAVPCPSWLSWMVELDNPFCKTNRAAVIVEQLGVKEGMRVLDAGCGLGRLTIPVAQRVGIHGKVTAMDIQTAMLEKVKQKASLLNVRNIYFLHAGLPKGRLEKNSYDRALLVTVLGEIPDKAAALKEIFDSLKPGGVLLISETIFDPHYQKRKFVLALATEVGFLQKDFKGNWLGYNMVLEKSGNEEFGILQTNNYQIIYFNGPSSAGKTTLARALQNALHNPFLVLGIDQVIFMMPEKLNDWHHGTLAQGFSW
jgi:2-polyprenyl-3-methyl-5-hydroxy-6-metoxy-1,4-benzoquinol methylase